MTDALQTAAPRGTFFSLRWRLLLVFTLLFMSALAILFLWFDRFTVQLALDSLKRDLRAAAVSAAAGIDGDEYARLAVDGALDDSDYLEISEFLRSVKRTNPKAAGMYTYIQEPGENFVRFVVSAALPPGVQPSPVDGQLADARPPGCAVPPNSRPAFKEPFTVEAGLTPAMLTGLQTPSIDDAPYTDAWGQWLSGFAPIHASSGQIVGAVGVDMCAADIATLQHNVRKITWMVFSLVFVVLSLAVFIIAYRISRPIIRLTRAADAIGQGNYATPIERSTSGLRDEVDRLADVFVLMVDKVREREITLKRQVAELQIIVDEGKRKQQVEEIVDSDFFRDLQAKAREARARRDSSRDPDDS